MPFQWDPRLRGGAGLYRDTRTGQIVSPRTVRRVLDDTLDTVQARMLAMDAQRRAGTLTLAQWEIEMMREIKYAHYAAVALDRGGVDRLRRSDIALAQQRVLFNFVRLSDFARAISEGRLSDQQIRARVGMYAQAPRNTFHRSLGRSMKEADFDEARSIRHARDSCTTSGARSGCAEQEALDWQPLDSFVHVGERTCLTSCRCHEEYRRSSDGLVVRLDV